MEPVNIKTDSVAARFLHAAVVKADHAGLRRSMSGKLVAMVTFQINGVTVPFAAIAQQMASELAAQADQLANARAEELVIGAGLGEAMAELVTARMAVRRAIKQVREKAPDGKTVEVL